MPEININTTATTDSARVQAPSGNVVYMNERAAAGSSYTVIAHPPAPRDQRPER